ncbi:probable pleckstrin homology domain-containing family N member 1 isoform X5 [Hyla sarda]|uniref:probable pleckstrin homology domain-containing family N member 1 isoform X5 n=1 Tax=Hyla sarda TaxID=327740 RepID=UPI0024C282D0|nr:probable pleckstrin homology domain-containing family N member 1 isoform X5 [Hyla sarda]
MGCCSVTARGTKENGCDGHEEAELLQTDENGKPSALSSPCTPSPNGGPCCITELAILNPGKAAFHTVQTQFVSKPILFWGRTREELNHMILIEPIQGWEGQGIRSYGNVVMSSLAVMQISHTEESTECFMVLFPLHLLILSMDHKERIFIYQGLLPLSGMNVVCERYNSGYTFEVSGPMIEPRQVSCLSSSERSQWISALQKHIQEANAHYPPVSPTISILSYLEFEDRILVLFPEDLVFLSVDANKTSVIHQGTLPLNAIHIEESLTWNRPLEFQITGDLMDPILIVCMTPEDYTKWIFHLQKPHHMPCGVTLHPLPSVPAKYRR